MNEQVDISHYKFSDYVDPKRFASFYYQLGTIMELEIQSILEVGPGNFILKKLLPASVYYKSVDFTKNISPDITASVTALPLKDSSFEMSAAFQVLEHIPFELFPAALDELARISSKHVFISLPNAHHEFSVSVYLPAIHKISFKYLMPRFYKKHKFDGQHYWEVGTPGCYRRDIEKVINKKLKIIKSFVPEENPYHIFYLLSK